jgi:hypothetical protein
VPTVRSSSCCRSSRWWSRSGSRSSSTPPAGPGVPPVVRRRRRRHTAAAQQVLSARGAGDLGGDLVSRRRSRVPGLPGRRRIVRHQHLHGALGARDVCRLCRVRRRPPSLAARDRAGNGGDVARPRHRRGGPLGRLQPVVQSRRPHGRLRRWRLDHRSVGRGPGRDLRRRAVRDAGHRPPKSGNGPGELPALCVRRLRITLARPRAGR